MKKSIWTRIILDLTGILMVLIPALVIAWKQPTAGSVPVTGISLDQTTVNMMPGESVTLKAVVAPADATVKTVHWSAVPSDAVTLTDIGDGRKRGDRDGFGGNGRRR